MAVILSNWVPIIVALLCPLVVGSILATFKSKLDQSVEVTKEASQLRQRSILERIENVDKRINVIEMKVDGLVKDFYKTDMKLEVVIAEGRHTVDSITSLRREVERSIASIEKEGFGKVVIKG